MNKFQMKAKVKRLDRKQKDLEAAPLVKRDHAAVAEVVRQRTKCLIMLARHGDGEAAMRLWETEVTL